MSFHFHSDKALYFKHQTENATNYVIPFIEQSKPIKAGMRVLEIGCAEGGVLKAFLDKGCIGVGVELSSSRLALAKQLLLEEEAKGQVKLIAKNIYDIDAKQAFGEAFDVIILKDVIEHIHNQARLMKVMQQFIKPSGVIFFGFPPWQMPFGGHQQICKHKYLSKLPYFHLLPNPLYTGLLKRFGETQQTIDDLLEIKETRLTLERFEKMVKNTGYRLVNKQLYFINPIYKYKFNIKPIKQNVLVGGIPYFRNYVTTCGYFLIRMKGLDKI